LACARAEAAGVQSERVIIDPGIGFGKNGQQNLELMRRLGEVRSVHHPMLIGTSRKSFIGTLLDLPPDERLEGTAATVTAAVLRGADIVRVHDVRAMTRVVRVAEQLRIRPTVCYLGLGANIGNREHQLSAARAELVKRGVTILRESSIAETEPFGVTDQPRFLNQVLEVEWAGTPHELLAVVKAVESAVGRTATYRWGPREIDVDVLLFGDERIDTPDLKVPHPGLFERAFVLAGLHELRPDILTR
ncbi:MAG: 2-amino-4-hydroxy-6-hydroxymethyldihydropteridine diphosphokinase, partial [Candidatus Dormibacteraeota bacterium]|nr:2-amino-4-hydroxy-6-hydroxymethyldihydropteridine diphosphokinase [Candidatus Dormibacteraeota bacterium]